MDRQAAIKIAHDYIDHLNLLGYMIKESYLFGSFAKDTNRPDSDIDIAIVLNDMKDSHEELVKMLKLRREVNLLIEPHPIRQQDFDEDYPLFYEIKNYGIRIS